MNKINLLQTCPHCGRTVAGVERTKADKQRMSAARMLAQHLAYTLQIRNGKNLVLLLGVSGQESDNLEALANWVAAKLDHIDRWPMPSSEAIELIERLERELKDILQDISFGWA